MSFPKLKMIDQTFDLFLRVFDYQLESGDRDAVGTAIAKMEVRARKLCEGMGIRANGSEQFQPDWA